MKVALSVIRIGKAMDLSLGLLGCDAV